MTRPKPEADHGAILAAVKVLFDGDDVIELRAMRKGKKRTDAGYFDGQHRQELAKHAARLNKSGAAVYVNLNPLDQQLLSRYANRVQEFADATATDANITARRWLLIDVDPVRPKDTSATDPQLEAAKQKASEVHQYLKTEGWPEPITAESGNGVHLLYRLNLPNDDTSRDRVKGVLMTLAGKFDDSTVKIDQSVFNAGRIVKLYGTVANKGDHTEQAPWRLSRLVSFPEAIQTVTPEQLEALQPPTPEPATGKPPSKPTSTFDLPEFLTRLGIDYTQDTHQGRERFKLAHCPFNPDHGKGEAAIFREAGGKLGFKCQHNSCADKAWADVRVLVDGPRETRQWEATGTERISHKRLNPPRDKNQPLPVRPTTISALELVQKHFDPIRWAIPGLLPAGVSLLVGAPKTGKSWLGLGVAIANASGGSVLGCIQVDPGRVLYLALEDNERRLKSRLEKLLNGAATPEGLHFVTEWPRLDNGAVECIEEHLTRYPDTRLIVIDTLAKIRPNTKGRDNLYEQDYAVGSPLLQLAGKHGLAIVLVHHTRKQESADPLDMVSGSTGLTGGVDNVLVLKRGRGTDKATLFVTGRDLEDETTYELNWNSQLATWAISGQGPHVGLSPERRRVYDVIAEHGPIHGRDIASAIHPGITITKNSKEWGRVRFLLMKLVDEGLVIVTDHGYSVNGDKKNGDKNITHTPNPAHNAHTPHTATPLCNAMTV